MKAKRVNTILLFLLYFIQCSSSNIESLIDLENKVTSLNVLYEINFDKVIKQYSNIFNVMPTQWAKYLAQEIIDGSISKDKLESMNSGKNIFNSESKTLLLEIFLKKNTLHILGNLFHMELKGYIFVSFNYDDVNPGQSSSYDLKQWNNDVILYNNYKQEANEEEANNILNWLNDNKSFFWDYKIHLMPKDENFYTVIYKLLIELLNNRELAEVVSSFKFMAKYMSKEELQELDETKRFPVIVIYTYKGKEYAEKAINIIKNLFKDISGMNLIPRFNQKVTDLIYFAQGNGDEKIAPGFSQYYADNKIYYKSDVMSIIGIPFVDFHLAF